MYCLQPDDRYNWWLEHQIDFYGGQVPTPFFGSTFGDATGFSSTFTYKCASSARMFVPDEGGALWEFTLPAATDWTEITPSSPTLYSGTPSGNLIWTTEPLRLISKKPFEAMGCI